ncbi:inhibitor of KinA sporulation pathway (predicted exonuclease) [Nonlabens dokdonensis]|jgi:inhibitor of KinA sporulation pathway (predicted exonuclease)|uniref:Exonuclease, RNase T and DNA polymerase III n=2 Tax=Nonlabens dokdonensis TaxID=328515 RepID=L7W9M7_NONDD|nr:exonuclease, RNase T and DNA polymerase III [Nonlabens dokdonensis DSW-6]PZX44448.1 inhibitor of KinA sporulation pathway (predicted exonuclease) [Nonlabens dokdonensis]
MNKDQIIIIDLEATCWNGKVPTGQVNEIIEIGICVLNTNTSVITRQKGILIQPERSTVSTFCTELTTITQELLDKEGVSFKEACTQLREEYHAHHYTWASYGAYDLNMMKKQCKMRGMEYPLAQNHINVKTLFSEVKGLKGKVGMKGALGILNFPLEGTHHRGVDDANNIAKILDWCLKNQE